jgi:mono/diheme cytochrome c family protein
VNESWKTACILTSLVLSAACSGGGGATEADEPDAVASAGGEASEYEGPIESTDVANGKALFDDFCGDCHPDGGEDAGPSLIDDPHAPATIRRQVREGKGKMRPFSEKRLSAQDLESVLAWLASVNAVK